MCVVGKSSQEGPGSHITRLLTGARGTFYCQRELQAPAKVAVARLLQGIAMCALHARPPDARLGMRREKSWRWDGVGLHCPQTHSPEKAGGKQRGEELPLSCLAKYNGVSVVPSLTFV